ncbi:hypothetical protein [Rhodopseudomonas sp. B29]|uniref:hypothetical protein n=1 Tax=Rhodopseudomonas sp. B29 TaxID=95607 RepID=UPI00034B19E8|nr:hypothetical protein [Rhodopseudomonas sp. B29]
MRLLTIMVSLWVVAALAMLPLASPAVASFIPTAQGAEQPVATAHYGHVVMDHATEAAMDESCHHAVDSAQAPASDHQMPAHDSKCPLGNCCIGVSIAGPPSVGVASRSLVFSEGRFPARIDRFVPDHAGAPPFRPPRA